MTTPTLMEMLNAEHARVQGLEAELAAVRQERDAAVEALRAVEWVPVYWDRGYTWYGCPTCHSDREYGKHTADCKLSAALQMRE